MGRGNDAAPDLTTLARIEARRVSGDPARVGPKPGRCGLSTQRYDANLRRWFGPKRAEDFGFDVHVDLTDAQSVGQRNYAAVTSGITFALHEPDAVLPRWQRQVTALRAAS